MEVRKMKRPVEKKHDVIKALLQNEIDRKYTGPHKLDHTPRDNFGVQLEAYGEPKDQEAVLGLIQGPGRHGDDAG